mmetsp:Transcript_28801/g.63082  ORF Transcript_28801/g.63082 Transcript_28801/m.63082 type:complete len:218 (-) Transcript_28801:614-1267(-)
MHVVSPVFRLEEELQYTIPESRSTGFCSRIDRDPVRDEFDNRSMVSYEISRGFQSSLTGLCGGVRVLESPASIFAVHGVCIGQIMRCNSQWFYVWVPRSAAQVRLTNQGIHIPFDVRIGRSRVHGLQPIVDTRPTSRVHVKPSSVSQIRQHALHKRCPFHVYQRDVLSVEIRPTALAQKRIGIVKRSEEELRCFFHLLLALVLRVQDGKASARDLQR